MTTGTDYLDGFQYVNSDLKFFPHPEGYVNVLKDTLDVVHYNYVFNYTDHLGNIRLSYGLDPHDDQVKILEENNYYPFGLKHTNYNIDHRHYAAIQEEEEDPRVRLTLPCSTCPEFYRYKYQGQERQDELELNWDSFKWRNYDYAIGSWYLFKFTMVIWTAFRAEKGLGKKTLKRAWRFRSFFLKLISDHDQIPLGGIFKALKML